MHETTERSPMVNCAQCGHANPEGGQFCLQCGARLQGPTGPVKRVAFPKHRIALPLAGAVVVVILSVLVYRVFWGESVRDYFLVEPKGRSWEYTVTATDAEGVVWTGNYRTTLVGEQVFEEENAIVHEFRQVLRTSVLGMQVEKTYAGNSYYSLSKDSLRQIGSEEKYINPAIAGSDIREFRFKFAPGIPVIKLPLRTGASWEEKVERITLKATQRGRDLGSSRRTETYSVAIPGKEKITLPAGTFEALKMDYRRSDGSDIRFTLWRVKGVGLVKYSGGRLEMELKDYQPK
jgi:hypothetical protein